MWAPVHPSFGRKLKVRVYVIQTEIVVENISVTYYDIEVESMRAHERQLHDDEIDVDKSKAN